MDDLRLIDLNEEKKEKLLQEHWMTKYAPKAPKRARRLLCPSPRRSRPEEGLADKRP